MMVTSDLTTSTSAVRLVVPQLSLARQLFPKNHIPAVSVHVVPVCHYLNAEYSILIACNLSANYSQFIQHPTNKLKSQLSLRIAVKVIFVSHYTYESNQML